MSVFFDNTKIGTLFSSMAYIGTGAYGFGDLTRDENVSFCSLGNDKERKLKKSKNSKKIKNKKKN